MPTPTTALDADCSDPGAIATSWTARAGARGRQTEGFWHVATVRAADRAPARDATVSVWLDDALHFCTGEAEQKAVNLRANDAVILVTGCNRWDRGTDVVVEGRATPVTDHAMLERLAEPGEGSGIGRWTYEVGDGCFKGDTTTRVLVFTVQPTKVLAFAERELQRDAPQVLSSRALAAESAARCPLTLDAERPSRPARGAARTRTSRRSGSPACCEGRRGASCLRRRAGPLGRPRRAACSSVSRATTSWLRSPPWSP